MDEFLSRAAQPQAADQGKTRSLGSAEVTAGWTESLANAGTLPRWSAPRFRTIRSHAKGGLGEVFLAEDLEFQREVALKEIQRTKLENPAARHDFSREATITGRLEHPNIAPVYSLGEFEDGRPFYVMRFIRGESLKEAIARFHGTLPPKGMAPDDIPTAPGEQTHQVPTEAPKNRELELRQLLGSFVQVCNAVAFAHSKGIIHRDIKPANIMLGDFGETLLVDWGLARAVGNEDGAAGITADLSPDEGAATQEGQIKGTPAYMSPEQARGDIAKLGPATDIYSLGATLYTLLTGTIPVEGKSTDEYLTNVKAGRVTPPRLRTPQHAIAKPLDAICMKAMALEPAERYASARLLAADIEHYQADEAVSAWQEPVSVRTQRWLRKHPAITAASVLLTVFAMVGSLGFAALERKHGGEMSLKNAQLATANTDLNSAKNKAEAREQMAINAVKHFADAVAGNPTLLKDGALGDLRKTLLKVPLAYFQQLRDELQQGQDTQPESLVRLASASFELARLSSDIGDKDNALRAYQESLETYKQLTQMDPRNSDYQDAIASRHHNIGVLLTETGRPDEAQVPFQLAVSIRERLALERPDDHALHSDLASNYLNLGIFFRNTGNPEKGMAAYKRALEIQERLVQAHPQDASLRLVLANTHSRTGVLLSETGQSTEGLAAYERARMICEQLVKEFPDVSDYQRDLAGTYSNISLVQLRHGFSLEALQSCMKSLAIAERLARDNPSITDYQDNLARNYFSIGDAQSGLGNSKEAQAAYLKAIEIVERLIAAHPSIGEYHSDLAGALVNLAIMDFDNGNLAAAREKLLRASPHHRAALASNARHPMYRQYFRNNREMITRTCVGLTLHAEAAASAREWAEYTLDVSDAVVAVVHICKCITLAKKDESLSDDAKKQTVQEYGDAAMEILTRLAEEGISGVRLTDSAAFNHPEFLPLSLRKDFRELLGSLGNADQ